MQLQVSYLNEIFIFVIFAASLNLLLGTTGQVSVAHGAFGAVGGYTLAYLFLNHGTPLWMGLVLGVAGSGLLGVAVGLPALRLTTEWLILLTLAVQTIVIAFASTSSALGGTYGLQNISGFSLFGKDLLQPTDFVPLLLAVLTVVLIVVHRMAESPYGRVLRGIREDEIACRSLGKNVFTYKLTVFGVTAAMAGLAGALLVTQDQIASPTLFGFDQSTAIIAMVILGGTGNMMGSVVGATVLVLLTPFIQNVLHFDADKASLWRLIAYGLVLLTVMVLRPQGLLPEGNRWWRRKTPASPRADSVMAHAAGELVHRAALPLAHDVDASGPDAVLSVAGLSKQFGGITAAHELSIELRRGTITALVGPNGAGKTTVFNLLTGAIRPDAGTITLKGLDITGLRPAAVAQRGMTRSFQDVRTFPRLSALDNVMLAVPDQPGEHLSQVFLLPRRTALGERRVREIAMQWLSFVGLESLAAQPAGSLSFGQQKLLALGRVLATDADVVLLDEPTSGVDQQWVDVMLGLIEELRAHRRTICIVEHNLNVVGRLADHTYFMELGRITAEGTFAELTSDRRLAEAYFGTA
jgi:branched-chain amino acid transport system permease protein